MQVTSGYGQGCISDNPIGDDGITHLAEALKKNTNLESLDISHCGITDVGVAPLAEALQVNNSLRELTVRGNDLTENGKTKLRKLAAEKSYFRVIL